HTRFSRDWSSDVCSSDLKAKQLLSLGLFLGASLCSAGCKNVDSNGETGVSSRSPNKKSEAPDFSVGPNTKGALFTWVDEKGSFRSEERRVGKECRCGGRA